VFEELTQLDNPLQHRAKGTGLGLSISRHLAGILRGRVWADSELGRGSTFFLEVPIRHAEVEAMQAMVAESQTLDPSRSPVLVVEDDRQTLFLDERYLSHSGFQVIPARTIEDAREALKRVRPAAVVLDIMLDGETSWRFLSDLKGDPATASIDGSVGLRLARSATPQVIFLHLVMPGVPAFDVIDELKLDPRASGTRC